MMRQYRVSKFPSNRNMPRYSYGARRRQDGRGKNLREPAHNLDCGFFGFFNRGTQHLLYEYENTLRSNRSTE
jgi:hypothetical protein